VRISTKIIFLIALFLGILITDGLMSQGILTRMGVELQGVVNRDLVLMQTAGVITRHQLQKAVIFERVRRIVEELAYQDTAPARREHLLFYTKLARNSFDELAKEGALSIVSGKALVDAAVKIARDEKTRTELPNVAAVLKEIERAHIHYDALVGNVFGMVDSGKYEISSEDLAQIHRDENKLTDELENLMKAVEAITKQSLAKSGEYQATAERVLFLTILMSLLAGLAIAFWIIRSINQPLRDLTAAAHAIGSGRLDISLKENTCDEIGEVSQAFNKMVRQLDESKKKIEAQSESLRRNLEVTEEQKRDLEKVNRELDRFVQTVSHDIRSPLMGIAWYADFLKQHSGENMDPKEKECLEGVCRGVERANALIKDLLALTRISRVRNPYEYVQTGGLVDEVVANLEYKIKESKVDIHIQPNMPSIICDGIKLREVFLNLMTNAIKFSSGNGDVQPKVEVLFRDNVDAHEFIVKDNGIGIDPKNHEEIFAIFKRLDTSNKYEGTGAGLSIVKSVIDDHGGRIWVESELGKGAAFHFTIPKALERKSGA
jgi:signal transduction histidine kinase